MVTKRGDAFFMAVMLHYEVRSCQIVAVISHAFPAYCSQRIPGVSNGNDASLCGSGAFPGAFLFRQDPGSGITGTCATRDRPGLAIWRGPAGAGSSRHRTGGRAVADG